MKKALSLILALIMIFAVMSVGVSAMAEGEQENVNEEVNNAEVNNEEVNNEEVNNEEQNEQEDVPSEVPFVGTPIATVPAAMTVSVADGNGAGVKGALVGLFVGDELKYSAETDKNGDAVLTISTAGDFTLKQISAPSGYIADSSEYNVCVYGMIKDCKVVLNTNPVTAKFVDQACGKLVLTCTVSGAQSTGLEITSYKFTVDIGGVTKSFKLTNGETATFDEIPYGTDYTITIDRTDATWNNEFVSKSGKISAASTAVNFVCQYRYSDTATPITMKVCTISSKDSSRLAGAKYTIYKDSSLSTSLGTATSDEDGMIQAQFTTAGTYYMRQTAATTGYTKSSATYVITTKNSGAYTTKTETIEGVTTIYIIPVLEIGINSLAADANGVFYIKNAPTSSGSSTSPQTGDSAELLFWSAALVITLAAGASAMYIFRRKEN